MDVKTEMPAAAGATHHPHPTGAKERTGALESAADHPPGRGRGVGVRVLVRAGSEKCRDVQASRMT